MSLWRTLVRMFGRHPTLQRPPRDPEVARAADATHRSVEETRGLLDQLRDAAEKRRLAAATRHYEERLHGPRGH